jgi:CBS domain-containing protein
MRPVTNADDVPITWIMTREVYCACEDLDLDELINIMMRHRIGSLPIVDHDGVPVGMVTKQDLVEQLIAARGSSAAPAQVAGQLMMPLAFILDERATVAHAASLMSLEGIHHVVIVADSGCLIGIVSALDVVRWLADAAPARIATPSARAT